MIPLNLSAALAGRRKYIEANDDNTATTVNGNCASGGVTLLPLRTTNTTGMTFTTKSPTGFTGLINQGATCYLNSLLQTLYCIAEFKSALFRSNCVIEGNDDSMNLCRQLQKLFTELEYTVRGAVSTSSLTKSFGWSSRESFQQQDVQECMTVIFEFIKVSYPESDIAHWIESCWQGEILSSLVCHGCGVARSKRSEIYRDLQLQVKGMKNLATSLQCYFQDEELDGVECEHCEGRHTHAQKKALHHTKLPEVLTVQLRRFDMDWNTFQRVKVHDTLDIDRILIIDPSIIDSCPSPGPKYELTSVMMHSGSAFAGHYFCYIKTITDQWLLFNDSTVIALTDIEVATVFANADENPHDVKAPTVDKSNDDTNDTLTRDMKKKMLLPVNRHAYMLVYRRVCGTSYPDSNSEVSVNKVVHTPPPDEFLTTVLEDNKRYLEEKSKYEVEREFLHITVHKRLPKNGDESATGNDSRDQRTNQEATKVIRIHHDKTLRDLTDMVHESFYNDGRSDTPKRKNMRLRVYDFIKDITLPATTLCPHLSNIAGSNTLTHLETSSDQLETESVSILKDIDESRFQKFIFTEVKDDDSITFSPLVDGNLGALKASITRETTNQKQHLLLRLIRYVCRSDASSQGSCNSEYRVWEPLPDVLSLSLGSNDRWREKVYESIVFQCDTKCQLDESTMVLATVKPSTLEGKSYYQLINLSNDITSTDGLEELLYSDNMSNSLTLYVEFCRDISKSPMLKYLDMKLNCMRVCVTALNADAKSRREVILELDSRMTLGETKVRGAEACEWKLPTFRFLNGESKGAPERRDMSVLLSSLLEEQMRSPSNVALHERISEMGDSTNEILHEPVPTLFLVVENVPSLAPGDLRVALYLKQAPTLQYDENGVVVSTQLSGDLDCITPLYSSTNNDKNEFIFHQDDLVKCVKRSILEAYGDEVRMPMRLQLLVQKAVTLNDSDSTTASPSLPQQTAATNQKATLTLSDELTFAQCLQSKSGSLADVHVDALCVTVDDVLEKSFNRDRDMLLALWEWIPASCRHFRGATTPLRKIREVVIPQSACFGDIKLILKDYIDDSIIGSEGKREIFFAKPFMWQLRTNPEENIPLLKWTCQPESDSSSLLEAPLRIQTNNRSKHMAPPVLLFKVCLPSQLDEIPVDDFASDEVDGSPQLPGSVKKGRKGRVFLPEASGFRLFTPQEQSRKQLEDLQIEEDRKRALATMASAQSKS